MSMWEHVRTCALVATTASESRLAFGVSSRLQRLSAVDIGPRPNGRGDGQPDASQRNNGFRGGTDPLFLGNAADTRKSGDRRIDHASSSLRDLDGGAIGRGASCGSPDKYISRMAQRADGLIRKAASAEQALVFMAKHVGNEPFYQALGAAARRRWPASDPAALKFARTFVNIELGIDGDGDEAAHLIECCLPPGLRCRIRECLSPVISSSFDWYGDLGRADSFSDDSLSQAVCSLCYRTWEKWGSGGCTPPTRHQSD